jgi:hypothetical protein
MNSFKRPWRSCLIALASAALVLVVVPAATSATGQAQYPDAAGDSGTAPDVTGVSVSSDRTSGQIVFRIAGTNLGASSTQVVALFVDSDANPVTGDISSGGADYLFVVDDTSYSFQHWSGSDWVDTSNATVQVLGGGSSLLISVNKSELGNTSDYNFSVAGLDTTDNALDSAPDDGMFNYSLDAGGPAIQSMLVSTQPTAGPKAGKRFVVSPLGLKLPPDGSTVQTLPKPGSYTCHATLKGSALGGSGVGGCTYRMPKNARGKKLKIVVTVTYEGATKSFPLAFKVS